MTAAYETAGAEPVISPIERLWNRQLHRYPNNLTRYTSLGIVVLITIVLYYEQYVAGGVATEILRDLHMSFVYYVNITVVASVAGAIASAIAGLADRYGRANIVTAGTLITGLLVLIAVPQAHSEIALAVIFVAIGFVEGIILVATPALIRDFSPQLGRASAMGFWTLGPVIGSLVVSAVVTPTFTDARAAKPFGWHYEYVICGIVGLVVWFIAFVGLRELSPALRDQLMVSEKDKLLIEARAQGFTDEELAAGIRNPFKQMMHIDVIASAFAIAVFLIIYYIAVGFFPIFFQTVFGYTASQANGIGNWFWAFDAGGLIVIGYLSDKARVRKPFMVFGALGAIAFTTLFSLHVTDKGVLAKYAKAAGGSNYYAPSHVFVIVTLVLLSVSLAFAFAPWMASFTETVEKHNPALTATGLAVWGFIIRIVIAIVVVILPHIVTSVTPVIEKGGVITASLADKTPVQTPDGATTVGGVLSAVAANSALVGQIQTEGAKYKSELTTAAAIDPQTLATLSSDPTNASALSTALGEISQKLGVSQSDALNDLIALSKVPKSVTTLFGTTAPKALGAANFAALTAVGTPQGNAKLATSLDYLAKNAPTVQAEQAKEPGQWMNYFWIAIGGEIVFLPLIFLMAGFWDPRAAKKAEEEHHAMVAAEMAKLEKAGA
ncbi:MAG TPA: MFS transporter [Mycobacteriales bacterium]